MRNSPRGIQAGELLAGRYRIAAPLGSGGTSRVLLAEDEKLPGKRWAVKELPIGEAAGGWPSGRDVEDSVMLRQAMLEEAETMSRLAHPSLPDIVDIVPMNREGFLYLIMEFIDGETLQERFVRVGGKMEAEPVVELALQLCALLDYLHTSGPQPIIHRDLKPANLMIDANGRVRLIDFGTARRFKPGGAGDTVNLGTIGFAAPEQYDGRQSDPRTDLYGLGALMYYLLSGGAYYDPLEQGRLQRLQPPDLEPIIFRLLRAAPDERYATARDAAAALRGWLADRRRAAGPAAGDAGTISGSVWRPPLVIVVGSLYRGAGATFVALALAQALEESGVPHALIEPPSPRPELAALLFAVKNEPPNYRYYDEAARQGGLYSEEIRWERGYTLWLPASDTGLPSTSRSGFGQLSTTGSPGTVPMAFGEAGAWFKLIHTLRRPVTIVDIGDRWEEPEAAALLETATDIVYVVDPLIHKLQMAASERRLGMLLDGIEPGCRRHAFANKFTGKADRRSWLQLLPEPVGCILPLVDFSLAADAVWNGRLPTEHPLIWNAVRYQVQQWVRRSLPVELGNDFDRQRGGTSLYRRCMQWFMPLRTSQRREDSP
ncbi:serine/threonine-protein kinase [Paenibacillus puerhi]|uniref:serine/threonine-protein kinase n=1 Tax=Paenibacillus puerhi TaxID=2692622 RepID=UPI001358FD1E|nr:serine/threonine-protein kinase [Paenibacillus puerhi]